MNLTATMKHCKAACGNRRFILAVCSVSEVRTFSENSWETNKPLFIHSQKYKITNNDVKLKITHESYVARTLHLKVFALEVIEASVVVLTSATARLVKSSSASSVNYPYFTLAIY